MNIYIFRSKNKLIISASLNIVCGFRQSVRLGDYDITNSGVDCVEVEGGGTDCTAEPLSIAISESIIHPEYKASVEIVHSNDIGLLRLQDLAPYTGKIFDSISTYMIETQVQKSEIR